MDAADMLSLAATVGAAIFVFVLLTLGHRHDMGRRRRHRAQAADFAGALGGVHSDAGRKVGSSSRRPSPRPRWAPKRGKSSDAGVFPTYIFASDGGGASHCSSDGGGGGGACDGGGAS